MGLNDMNFSGFNADEAAYNRQNRLGQSEFAPGMQNAPPPMDAQSDIFATSTMPNNQGAMNDMFNQPPQGDFSGMGGSSSLFGNSMGGGGTGSIFNQGVGMPSPNGMNSANMMQQQPQRPKTGEDMFWEGAGKAAKNSENFIKDLTTSFKGLTPLFHNRWGWLTTVTSLVCIASGVVFRIFGLKFGLDVAIGGCLAGAIGVVTMFFTTTASRECTSMYIDENNSNQSMMQPPPPPQQPMNDFSMQNDMGFGIGGSPQNDFGSGFSDSDFSDSNFNDSDFDDDIIEEDDEDDWGSGDWGDVDEANDEKEPMSAEDALATMPVIDSKMYTRQYLYDMFTKVLPNIKSRYSNITSYDEDDEVFLFWDDIVARASLITGLKEEDELPYLKGLDESLFTVKLTIERVPKMKPELVADEIAKAYAYKTYDDPEERSNVFAKAETYLNDCIITVFTGNSYMISLLDMYANCEDFILNKNNSIPIVLGVNEMGKVICTDFKKIESIIVAGMPRSGKTWLVQAILTQMCALLSPRELVIFILDPKAETSDYNKFCLPHVKAFASAYTDAQGNHVNKGKPRVLDTLRWVVNTEAPRRKALIGGNSCVNINDFKERYPDVDLPYLYIVVDEMVTLSNMEKEEEKEYQSYLDMIVTQFPNLGIRGMFIPHEVKNQIISKTAYDSIKARISVKGSPEHIESSTGTKPRAFPYKLCNTGDMAVNIDTISRATLFVHGVALTDSNAKNNDIFDYLRRMWTKLEPDCVEGSVAIKAEEEFANKKLLEQVTDDTSDVEVFSNPNEGGLSGMQNVSTVDDSVVDIFQ